MSQCAQASTRRRAAGAPTLRATVAVLVGAATAIALAAPTTTARASAPPGAGAHAGVRTGHVHPMPTVHSRAAASSSAVVPHLTYYGGHVLPHAQVIQVLYGAGAYEAEVSRTAAPSIASFYAGVTSSQYYDMLTQYSTNIRDAAGNPGTNQLIGRGSFVSQVTITPALANDGATIDDANISAELQAQVAAGTLPPENGNLVYAMYFPVGKTITLGPGQVSGVAFCAYHGTTGGVQELYYSVLPDFSTGAMASHCGNGTEFQNVTAVSSHELAEATTDPEVGLSQSDGPPLAWYYDNPNDPNQSQVGEAADICNGQDATASGGDGATYTVQKLWSNSQNACVTQGPANDFSLAVQPSAVTVTARSPQTATVSTAVTAGSPGGVALSASAAPSGVQLAFNPASVSAGNNSMLTVTAANYAAPGNYLVTVTGVGGSATHTATLALSIRSVAYRAGIVAVNDSSAWVMSSNGSSFAYPSQWSSSTFFGSVATLSGDIAGSGHQALVAVNGDSVWVMLSDGSQFSAPQRWASTAMAGNRATLLADVNGDGRADLVAVNDNSVFVMLSTGSGFSAPTVWSSGAFFGSIATLAGDVSGDGRADLVAVNGDSSWVMTSTGAGFSAPTQWSAVPFYGGRATLAGDVTGDGRADLVAVNNDSSWVMASTGRGFSGPTAWSQGPFYGSRATVLGDVSGDGALDLVAVNGESTWVMTAAGSRFATPTSWSSSPCYGSRETIVGS